MGILPPIPKRVGPGFLVIGGEHRTRLGHNFPDPKRRGYLDVSQVSQDLDRRPLAGFSTASQVRARRPADNPGKAPRGPLQHLEWVPLQELVRGFADGTAGAIRERLL